MTTRSCYRLGSGILRISNLGGGPAIDIPCGKQESEDCEGGVVQMCCSRAVKELDDHWRLKIQSADLYEFDGVSELERPPAARCENGIM